MKLSPALTAPLEIGAPRRRVTGIASPVTAASSITALLEVDDAVDRNDLPGPYEQPVADGNIADGHLLNGAAGVAVRDTRCPLDQASQILFGAPDRDILEQVAARIHQRDDRACERLTQRKRANHGDKRDRIDAEATGDQVTRYRDNETGRNRKGCGPPECFGKFRMLGELRRKTGGQPTNRDRDQSTAKDSLLQDVR